MLDTHFNDGHFSEDDGRFFCDDGHFFFHVEQIFPGFGHIFQHVEQIFENAGQSYGMLDIFLIMLNDTASMLDKPSASSKGMLDKFLIILDKRRFILNILRKCRTFQPRYRTFRPSRRGPCWTFSANNKEIKISGISPWRNNHSHTPCGANLRLLRFPVQPRTTTFSLKPENTPFASQDTRKHRNE